MRNKVKYLIKNIGILTISNFASKILVFLLVPLYTTVLSTEDIGRYDLIISTISLLFPILTVNIIDAVMRFLMDRITSKDEIAVIGLKYIAISMLISLIFIIFIKISNVFPLVKGFEIYIIMYYISYVFNQFLIQFSKGLERIKDMGIAGVLGTFVMIIANILFLLVFHLELYGFFIANILAQIIPASYLLIKIKIWTFFQSFKINKDLEKEMLRYCIPLITTAVGWWINSASDKYIVSFLCGISANGLLSIAYKIPQVINTLHNIFIQAWQISAIKEYGNKDTNIFYSESFIFLNIFMAGVCSILILFTKPLGQILYKNEFYIAWKYVPFLIISCVINSASGFLGSVLSAKKDSKSMALSAIYGAIANIVMNIFFILLIGIQGATIATVVSSLIIYFSRKKAVGKDIVMEESAIILFTWILLCIQAIIEIYTPFWWFEIVLMILILLINWNKIKKYSLNMVLILSRTKNRRKI